MSDSVRWSRSERKRKAQQVVASIAPKLPVDPKAAAGSARMYAQFHGQKGQRGFSVRGAQSADWHARRKAPITLPKLKFLEGDGE